MGKFLERFSNKISATDKQYKRKLYQTYLTSPEWRNVEMAEEFAAFLKANNPFYRYPFFKQILVFWQVFFRSYAAARKKHGHLELIFSEYMLMNLFIGINSTLEFAAKGFISTILWPFLPKKNNTVFQEHLADVFQDYANFIQHTPFYNYSYFSKLRRLFSNFWHSSPKSFIDFVSLFVISLDFITHGIISAPVGLWYNQEANKEVETIDIIVKKSTDQPVDVVEFSKQFQHQINNIPKVTIVNEHAQAQLFTRHSNSKKPEKSNRTYVYAHLRVPRYKEFQKTVEQLIKNDINVREIAGQDHVQLKCVASGETLEQLNDKEMRLTNIPGVTKLYTYQNGINNNQTFFSLDLNTKTLNTTIEKIQELDDVNIQLIHDF